MVAPGGDKMQEQINAVQRMQEYIEEHLCEDISFADVAKVSLFSPWYARRLFLEYTDVTPSKYIRKLRLKQSALKLRDENVKILDVAMDYGFGSVDGYQRAFLKEFGCNPSEYSANPIPLNLFTPYGVKFKFLERKKTTVSAKNVFLQVIDKPKRKVIIKRGKTATEYMKYCEEVGCDIWESEKKYDPSVIGYKWDDSNPKIQLEPIGTRGYIELLPIRSKI